jgi:hypothetical protein
MIHGGYGGLRAVSKKPLLSAFLLKGSGFLAFIVVVKKLKHNKVDSMGDFLMFPPLSESWRWSLLYPFLSRDGLDTPQPKGVGILNSSTDL